MFVIAHRGAVNKIRIGFWMGLDRIGRVSSLLVQNSYLDSYLEKSSFNNDTGGSHFFFRAACVTNKKVVSYVSPGLKFTISLKIMSKTYFQLNRTGKFSVAWLHTITIPKRGLVKWNRPNRKCQREIYPLLHWFCVSFHLYSFLNWSFTKPTLNASFQRRRLRKSREWATYDSDLLSIREWHLKCHFHYFH